MHSWYLSACLFSNNTQGKTLQEVLERIKEAIEVCLEADKEEVNPMRFVGIQRVQVERPQII